MKALEIATPNQVEPKDVLHKTMENSIRSKKPRMAICYDFDKTLSPNDMQTFTLIPSLGMKSDEFWEETKDLAIHNLMDNNLAWMYQLIVRSKPLRKSISKSYFHEVGKDIPLYNGVESWFSRINEYAEKKGIQVEHYIISSGLKELIEGSSIAKEFSRIYASSYYYSPDGVAEWPAQAVNYTNKTQFIFRIAKGIFEEYDERVNDSMQEKDLYIPYENIVYIGDSATDIPCMRLVKSKGGFSIGVYDPDKDERDKVYQLYNDHRISYYAPADYSDQSKLFSYMKQIIDSIAAKEIMKTEQEVLNIPVEMYAIYRDLKKMSDETLLSEKQRDDFSSIGGLIRGLIEGKIE